MTVSQRIALLIALAFTALCSVGGYALLSSHGDARAVRSVTEGVVPSTIESVELMGRLKDVQIAALAMVAAPDSESTQRLLADLRSRKSALQEALAAQMRQSDSDAQRGLVKEAQLSLENYFTAIDETAQFKLDGQQALAEANMDAMVDQYLREQGQMIATIQVEKRRSKDEAIAALNRSLARTSAMLATLTVAAVLAMCGLGYLLYRQIVRPIAEMESKMTAIAASQDFSLRVPVGRRDEIGRSLIAFNTMVEKIQHSSELLRQKTADMEAILRYVRQGILTLEADARIHPEHSHHLATLLETDAVAGHDLMELVFSRSSLGADALAQIDAAIGACIGEDAMNFEFNAHLLVREIQYAPPGGRAKVLELDWSPITDAGGRITRLMLCLRDVTELRHLARAADAQARELAMIGELLALAPSKFDEFAQSAAAFLDDNDRWIDAAEADPARRAEAVAALFRNTHTIKGNARTYGLLQIAETAHRAEQRYAALREAPQHWEALPLRADLAELRALVASYRQISEGKLGRGAAAGQAARSQVAGDDALIDGLAEAEASRDPARWRAALAQTRAALALRDGAPLHELVETVSAALPSLADELGKEPPQVEVVDDGTVLRRPVADTLRNTFTHLLRNALDHGIEPGAERLRLGKPAAGRIRVALASGAEALELRIGDDGRGLDLERLRARGVAAGLFAADAAPDDEEIAAAVFHPGVSTAAQITAVSGRGVGMDAVKRFVEAAGGSIRLQFTGAQSAARRKFETVIRLPAHCGVRKQPCPT